MIGLTKTMSGTHRAPPMSSPHVEIAQIFLIQASRELQKKRSDGSEARAHSAVSHLIQVIHNQLVFAFRW
jgi:hypothetical protein